jgi:glucosyl-dolichyl phosphate glucuronosyltransferase
MKLHPGAQTSEAVLSIIIPTRNRASLLVRTLDSVASVVGRLDPVEVIVVDNGSQDGTAAAYRAFREKFPDVSWRYVYDQAPGLLTGRHRGAREATGNILCYLDDDVLLGPNWLAAVQEAFADPGVVVAGGPSVPQFETQPPEWLNSLYFEHEGARACGYLSVIYFGSGLRNIDPCLVWGLNFAIRKEKLYEFGGFHPDGFPRSLLRFRGDGETGLSLKLKKAGISAVYHSEMLVRHVIPQSRMTLRAFEGRAFCQGISDSYTEIRESGMVPAFCSRSWKEFLTDSIRAKLDRIRLSTNRHIHEILARAHFAGKRFHKKEVRTDPELLAWVLRENYFDYELPQHMGFIRRLQRQ